MVGMYIKHADKSFRDYFQSLTMLERKADVANDAANDNNNEATPRRGQLRKKHALEMVGENKVCEVGEVVHVPLKDMGWHR